MRWSDVFKIGRAQAPVVVPAETKRISETVSALDISKHDLDIMHRQFKDMYDRLLLLEHMDSPAIQQEIVNIRNRFRGTYMDATNGVAEQLAKEVEKS